MDHVEFAYGLTGVGFFHAMFRIGEVRLEVRQLGDNPDPLDELMIAALALARGEDPRQLIWDPEDGSTYLWDLRRKRDQLRVRVSHVGGRYVGRHGRNYGPPGRPLDASCSVHEFCSVVASTAGKVIAQYGPGRYEELRQGPFSFDLLADLQAAVAKLSA